MALRPKPVSPRVDRAHPMARGLIGAWAFTGRAGTVVPDLSGWGGHGASVSAPPWQQSHPGYALDFDGSADYVDLSTSSHLDFASAAGPLSITAWVRRDVTSTYMIALSRGATNPQYNFTWAASTDGTPNRLRLSFRTSAANVSVYGGSAHTDTATWHLIGVTCDGANIRFYWDGAEDGVTAETRTFDSVASSTTRIGAFTSGGAFSNGQIADVRVWRRVLSGAAMAGLFADPWRLYSPPPFALPLFTPQPIIVEAAPVEVEVEVEPVAVDLGAITLEIAPVEVAVGVQPAELVAGKLVEVAPVEVAVAPQTIVFAVSPVLQAAPVEVEVAPQPVFLEGPDEPEAAIDPAREDPMRFRMEGFFLAPLQFYGVPGATDPATGGYGPIAAIATGDAGDRLRCLGVDTAVVRVEASYDGATGWTEISGAGPGLVPTAAAGETWTFYVRFVFLARVPTAYLTGRGVVRVTTEAAGGL